MAVRFRTGPDWQDVRVFVVLARLGGLSATARALGVDHVTVGRRVARLEQALGVTLFDRRPDGYRLTAAAAPVLTAAQQMEDAAAALVSEGPAPGVIGLVRLTATESLIDAFLAARVAPLVAAHPSLELEILADRRALSLARHETDLAIRGGRPEDGELIARPLAEVAYGIFGAPEEITRVEAGAAPRFVGFDEANGGLPEARWLARAYPDAAISLRAGAHVTQAAASAAGLGLAVLPAYIAAGAGLRHLATGPTPPPRRLWLLSRADVRATPRFRAVADFLVDLFRREKALFTSLNPPP